MGRGTNLVTPDLLAAMRVRRDRADQNAPYLQAAADEYGIDTHLEVCHWLAQVCHESACLRYVWELWGDTPAQQRYDTRKDLGNTPEQDGDGKKNRGVGWIQTTGEANIERALAKLGYPPDSNHNLATPAGAARSAALFWFEHGLDAIAIRAGRDVRAVTRVVNGGYNGLAERQAYFDRAMTYMAGMYL